MKKNLILLAAALVALVGCKKDNSSAVTGIAINPDKIEKFYVGDTVRLGLIISPDGAEFPEDVRVVWTSSDEEVASVVSQNGTVTSGYPGDAVIKVTAGELSAACQIHANYEALFWNVAQIFYFPSSKSEQPLNDEIVTIDGKKCKLYSVTFLCPNGNDFNEDYSAGEGYALMADVSAYFPIEGTAEEQASLAGNRREITLVTSEEEWKSTPYTALVGELDPAKAGPIYQEFFEKRDAGDQSAKPNWTKFKEEAMKGAYLCEIEMSNEGVSYSHVPDALVKEGFVKIVRNGDNAYLDYDLKIQWILSGWWGLAVNEDAESYSELLLQPYQLCESAMVHYDASLKEGEFIEENEGGEGAPRRLARKQNRLMHKIAGKPVPYFTTEKIAK